MSSCRHDVPVTADGPYRSDLLDVIRRMEQGRDLLPRHYRLDHKTTPDPLLERDCHNHIHLGRQSSDVLPLPIEFEDLIALVETNSHEPFVGIPSGVDVGAMHYVPVAEAFAEHEAEGEAAAPARDRAEALRLSLVAARRRGRRCSIGCRRSATGGSVYTCEFRRHDPSTTFINCVTVGGERAIANTMRSLGAAYRWSAWNRSGRLAQSNANFDLAWQRDDRT